MKKVLVLFCLLTVGAVAAYYADVTKLKSIVVADNSSAPVVPAASSSPTHTGKRVALVIGNADYQNVDDLPNDENDANDMEAVLQGFGFEVIKLINADIKQIDDAVAQFSEKTQQEGSVGLLYYSGHGIELEGKQYIVPTDASLSSNIVTLKRQMMAVDDILNMLANKQLNILILDACRNNPAAKALRLKGLSNNGFSQISAVTGTLIASATASGDVSSAAGERNSVYTAQLLKQLREKPTDELKTLLGDVGTAVKAATNDDQQPWVSFSYDGHFFFQDPLAQSPEPTSQQKPTVQGVIQSHIFPAGSKIPKTEENEECLVGICLGMPIDRIKLELGLEESRERNATEDKRISYHWSKNGYSIRAETDDIGSIQVLAVYSNGSVWIPTHGEIVIGQSTLGYAEKIFPGKREQWAEANVVMYTLKSRFGPEEEASLEFSHSHEGGSSDIKQFDTLPIETIEIGFK